MAIIGKPRGILYSGISGSVETDLEKEFYHKDNLDIRLRNHEQRIAANEEGLNTVNKRLSDIDDSLDDSVETVGKDIADIYTSVNSLFENITKKDEPDGYQELREQLSTIKKDIEEIAAVVREYQTLGFNAATWRTVKNDVLELDTKVSAMPTSYNNVFFTNVGVLTEEIADKNFKDRIMGNFAAIKGNLRCSTGDNPFTGWWLQNFGSGRGMICNLYTLEVWSLSRKSYDDPVKFKIIFRNGQGMSDQELFPDEKILIDVLMAAGMTATLWNTMIFDISNMCTRLPYVETLRNSISDDVWLVLLSDLEKVKSVVDIAVNKLSVNSWKQVIKVLLNRDPDTTGEEEVLRKLKTAGLSAESWYEMLVSIGNIGSVILSADKTVSFDITAWEKLLRDLEEIKEMVNFMRLLSNSNFNSTSWNMVVRRFFREND